MQMFYGAPNSIPCCIFGKGAFFGEIELLVNTNRVFSCVALTRCVVLSIDKKEFQKLCFMKFPKLGRALNALLPLRLRSMQGVLDKVDQLIKTNVGRQVPTMRRSLVSSGFRGRNN